MIATTKLQRAIKPYEKMIPNDYHQNTLDVIFSYWHKNTYKSYLDVVNWTKKELGDLALFALLIGQYDQQVTNGGHIQYFENGYGDGIGGRFSEHDPAIPIHKDLIRLFKQTPLNDPISLEVLEILESFHIIIDDMEYIEEELRDEFGDITIEEYENENYKGVKNHQFLDSIDKRYYKINEQFMEIVETYLKQKLLKHNKIYKALYKSDNKQYQIITYIEAPSKKEAILIAKNNPIQGFKLVVKSILLLTRDMNELDKEEQDQFINGTAIFEAEPINS